MAVAFLAVASSQHAPLNPVPPSASSDMSFMAIGTTRFTLRQNDAVEQLFPDKP
jgi:hypothetical protein